MAARARTKSPSNSESQAVENYLKQIHAIAQRAGNAQRAGSAKRAGSAQRSANGAWVLMGDLASALDITPGTVTSMVKRLSRRGLVRYQRYGGVQLTAEGTRMAVAVQRRHRVIETFLVRALGLDWSEVHDEAERLEHVLSDRVLGAIDRFLGHPSVDPHGDPIPRGAVEPPLTTPLSDCAVGSRARIERMLEQSPDFLRFASRHGLRPGVTVVVDAPGAGRGIIRLRVGRRETVTLARELASRVLVVPARAAASPPKRGSRPPRRG